LTPIHIVYASSLACWLWHIGWEREFHWYLLLFIPLSIVIYAVWSRVERSIKADVKRCEAGEPMLNGIPHHGVFFVKACALFLLLGTGVGKAIAALHDGLRNGVMVFALDNLITNALVIVAVLVLCRIERGYDPMLNYDGRKEEKLAQ
jgi:hypothetical protein